MKPSVDDMAPSALLGPDGPFAHEVPNFAPRATQQRMADAVADAIDDHNALVVEAGTGTGKTFAYLCGFVCNQGSVSCVSRENAAEVALPRRPAKKLVMR